MSRPTYLWRQLTPQQRDELLAQCNRQGLPWHRPPHRASEKTRYHITAACFEHRHFIGHSEERMRAFCATLLGVFKDCGALTHAWCVLPNHYHALIEVAEPAKAGT